MSIQWLPLLPIQRDPYHPTGFKTATGELVVNTFEDVANAVAPLLQSSPLPLRQREIRVALALTLRYAFDPAFQGKGPWLPKHPRYQPYRATIATLLAIKLWQESTALASAYTLWLPSHHVAGTADAIIALKDDSIAVVSLFTEAFNRDSVPAIQIELGGFIACLIDQRVISPDHGIAIWVTPTAVTARKYSAQTCLNAWVDGLDLAKLMTRPPGQRGAA